MSRGKNRVSEWISFQIVPEPKNDLGEGTV
jgi:hypothetical protein